MKKSIIWTFVLLLAAALALPALADELPAGFSVEGTCLLDANGNEFVLRGVNFPYAWYRDKTEVSFAAIAATGANSIRIVCGSGLQYPKTTAEEIEMLVALAREHRMIAVLEVHDVTGSNNLADLEQVADYWAEMADALAGTEAYCIVNIANEWVGKWDGKLWRDGYVAAIVRLREAGIRNTIMIDAGGWGQYGQCVREYGVEVFSADPDANTMFSVHMYGTAGKNAQTIATNLQGATLQGLCVCVGEFGHTHSDGDVDEAYILRYCAENGIGYMGWSWKGNSGGVEYLDIALEWDGSVLSPDWGEVLVNGEYGIRNTALPCTIFAQ